MKRKQTNVEDLEEDLAPALDTSGVIWKITMGVERRKLNDVS